jgi:hypothetical protein
MRGAKGLGGLMDQMGRERRGEAHQHDDCGYRGNQVNGPRVIAFAHKVDMSRAAFVSIYVKVHSSRLRLRMAYLEEIPDRHHKGPFWPGEYHL